MTTQSFMTTLLVIVAASCAHGFICALFQKSPTSMQRKAPSKMEGITFDLPDFEELFERIQQVSPLDLASIMSEALKESSTIVSASFSILV